MIYRTSTLMPPKGRWWGPVGKDEKLWLVIVVLWAVTMFVMMQLIWPAIGEQHANIESYRVDPATFVEQTEAFIVEHQVDEYLGVPVIAPPPGDVFLLASRFAFRPVVRLERGKEYRFLISSPDVQHGFSLQPGNINFQVLPGYITGIKLAAENSGDYTLICNEYCGNGHHLMLGRIEVVDKATTDAAGALAGGTR